MCPVSVGMNEWCILWVLEWMNDVLDDGRNRWKDGDDEIKSKEGEREENRKQMAIDSWCSLLYTLSSVSVTPSHS